MIVVRNDQRLRIHRVDRRDILIGKLEACPQAIDVARIVEHVRCRNIGGISQIQQIDQQCFGRCAGTEIDQKDLFELRGGMLVIILFNHQRLLVVDDRYAPERI
jgi:hypothetical protein